MNPASAFTIDEAQIEEAANVLADAFQNDSGTIYTLPDAEQRKNGLPVMFRVMIRHGLNKGKVIGIDNPLKAVSIWLPPLNTSPSEEEMGTAGIADIIPIFQEKGMSRLGNLVGFLEQLHTKLIQQPHYRLFFLGVRCEFQGKGIGSSLIQPFLQKLVQEQIPCYLDTLEQRNVTFYKKNGFRVLEEITLPDSNIPVWAMLKD